MWFRRGVLGDLWDSDSFTPISDRPDRDRACRAAFEVRQRLHSELPRGAFVR